MKYIFLSLALVSASAFGGETSTTASRCTALKSIDQEHQNWKKDFLNFSAHQYEWDSETRFDRMNHSLNELLTWMDSVRSWEMNAPESGLTAQARQWRDSIQNGKLTSFDAAAVLKPGLPKISDQLSKMLEEARRGLPGCDSTASVPTVSKAPPDAAN